MFYTPISLTHLHILIGNCLGSDTNQCTSQVNPGEIEIHLLTSDYNQSALRQVHLSFKKTQDGGTMGDNCGRKAEEITSQTLQASLQEVLVVLSKEHMGLCSED